MFDLSFLKGGQDSTPFNCRIYNSVCDVFDDLYVRLRRGGATNQNKYNKTKLISIAVLLLSKTIKDKKIKAGDDIAKKLGL